MKRLSAPWRWSFISGLKKMRGCIFCAALQEEDENSLICHRGSSFFVILNKYPYTTGHLMIAPKSHLSSPAEVSPAESQEMWSLMNDSLVVLQKAFSPDGFNIGMNIGSAAGAGIKDHFHLHLVPRWQGDANFLPVIGGTKLVSYDLQEILKLVRSGFSELGSEKVPDPEISTGRA